MTFKKIRTGFGVAIILALATGAVLRFETGSLCYFHIGMSWLVCPIGFLEICVNSRTIHWDLFPFALVGIVLAAVLGRAFCSWVCPVMFVSDWADQVLSSLMPERVNLWRASLSSFVSARLPKLTYKDGLALLLGAFAGIVIFKYPFISIFCPIGVVTRNIIDLFTHLRVSADLIFLLIPLIAGYFFVGGWRACCPAGLIHSMGARANALLIPSVDHEKCAHCGLCRQKCLAGLPLGDGYYDKQLCIKCFKCVDNCPNRAVSLKSSRAGDHQVLKNS
ncbi:MAG TPA: 4Fe-4S binding protein [Desulfomonilaceae bacterium]|nr:4Fe-4S binding protein [Desulfomonilaceae bacterium]